jgi:aryl-alcohol dehydrogenase-like predicted oxidoreductase
MPASLTKNLSKITLGTAQLGFHYGIANSRGCPTDQEAFAILDKAMEGGVNCLDTARAYGKSEERIGAWCRSRGSKPLIISKLPSLQEISEVDVAEKIEMHFAASCKALGVSSLSGYLVHRAEDLLRTSIPERLRKLQAEGYVGAFGASVYSVEQAEQVLGIEGVGLVQVPVSVFHHSIVFSGILEKCLSARVSVFARSVFLQGLFFLDPERLPRVLQPAQGPLRRLHQLVKEAKSDIASLAIQAVRDLPGIASIVVGVECPNQLAENLRAISGPTLEAGLMRELWGLGREFPPNLLNPTSWGKNEPASAAMH